LYCDREMRQIYDGRIKVDYSCHKAKMTKWRWSKLKKMAEEEMGQNEAEGEDYHPDDWKGIQITIRKRYT